MGKRKSRKTPSAARARETVAGPPPGIPGGTLYIVGTPIGNLGDITQRAVTALREADCIAAEDTRWTRKLLSHLGITCTMVSYRAHNQSTQATRLIRLMEEGKTVALVTDAGMPGISDPGFYLVMKAADSGIPVETIPGVSALTAALSISGFPSERFIFEGFLPQKKGRRRRRLENLVADGRCVALFESPHRIVSTVGILAEICPGRPMVLAREITKLHEEIIRGTAYEVAMKIQAAKPRGEYTVILSGEKAPTEPGPDSGTKLP